MVYSEHKGKRAFIIVIVLLVFGAAAYYFAGTQIKDFLNKNLLSQVTFRYEGDTPQPDSELLGKEGETVLTISPTSTSPPAPSPYADFMNELEIILTNHSGTPNNYQSVKRAQTTKSLLEAFVNQL